jgi:alkanesulfonate monooxygenase SsuD/methylene tetrahydromethanopterin reductase-like flavin-dependent oxidoreductase (luciferase family)
MKVGITLPQFRPTVAPSVAVARAAEAAGVIDGVFVFDHVYAIGNPARPARNAWPLLGALAGATDRIALGPLVARVSLLPNAVLAHNLETLHRMLGDRLIAGLGAGDRLSAEENALVDVPFPPADVRLADLADAARRVRALGVPVWLGGLSPKVHDLAVAEGVALNLWGVDPDRVAATTEVEVTWGGPMPKDAGAAADLLVRLSDAGATWAVLGPPFPADGDPLAAVDLVAEAMTTAFPRSGRDSGRSAPLSATETAGVAPANPAEKRTGTR